MKRLLMASTILVAASAPAWSQSATGTGVGIANSSSKSDAAAVAVSGQGGTGVGGNPTSNVTINSTVPSQTLATVRNEGTSTIKNVPIVFAPGLAAAGIETCLGSVSAGGSFVGTGLTFGSTVPDAGCNARLTARTLWSMGLKKAAVARICLDADVYRSMPEVCSTYLPQPVPIYAAPPVVSPYRLSENESYHGGQIMLVDGKTGKDRLCNSYDEPKQRCRVWADNVVTHAKSKRVKRDALPAVAQPSTVPNVGIPTAENTEGK